ncbi:MAG TPA: hypothetical protein VJQ52_20860 [Steroidobacteraceae bacterium]|nr:hypothetical protein [Steroidobacteraceae bacterium]
MPLQPSTSALWRLPILATLAILTACAGPSAKRDSAPAASSGQRLSGNADEFASDALQAFVAADSQRALASIARANVIAADRPELAWLHARICATTPGCQAEPIETRLRKLAPENGVVWLGPLARAQARQDKAAEQQILDVMSRAQRFDLYWTSLVWRLSAAFNSNSPPPGTPGANPQPLTHALDSTTEALSAVVVPAFKPLSTACNLDRTQDPATRTQCQRIAEAMQRSDSTLVEGLGLGIAQRLATPASPDAIVLDERVATLSYRSQAAGAVVREQVERDKFSAQMLELMKKLPREQDVALAILRWAGQPLLPAK